MSGGGQQQAQSYNSGGFPAYAMGGQAQPSFMSQPNYGYQNPYANIYSQLSQQQAMQPPAPLQITGQQPSAPSQASAQVMPPTSMPATFSQAANNQAAGLPATGQASNAPVVPGVGSPPAAAPAAPPPASNPASPMTIAQFAASPGGGMNQIAYNNYLKGLGGTPLTYSQYQTNMGPAGTTQNAYQRYLSKMQQ